MQKGAFIASILFEFYAMKVCFGTAYVLILCSETIKYAVSLTSIQKRSVGMTSELLADRQPAISTQSITFETFGRHKEGDETDLMGNSSSENISTPLPPAGARRIRSQNSQSSWHIK